MRDEKIRSEVSVSTGQGFVRPQECECLRICPSAMLQFLITFLFGHSHFPMSPLWLKRGLPVYRKSTKKLGPSVGGLKQPRSA